MNLAGIILGHLVGDYLLQNQWMATNKKKDTVEGFFACLIHCTIWSLSVMFFGDIPFTFNTFTLVLFSHWILDWTYLASTYMWVVNIFNWRHVKNARLKMTDAKILQYAIVDNTLHLVILWGMIKAGVI
jgi:hypothetical protein